MPTTQQKKSAAGDKSSGSAKTPRSNQVKVILRVRPRHEHEQASCVVVENEQSIRIVNPRNDSESLVYSFERCYDEDAPQTTVFEQDVQPLLGSAFDGINTCIFAYGITGAGKTFTIQGSAQQPGIIPRAIESYLSEIRQRKLDCQMGVSFFEIYCENVIDLLVSRSKAKNLDVREDPQRNIIVAGLSEVNVKSLRDFEKAFEYVKRTAGTASANRSVASTNLNAHSSRSHLIMRIMLKTKRENKTCTGKVHIIDLAGSENNKRTGNVGKERMAESGAINKSLFTLSQVVDALNEGRSRIPYRESKMTRILQDSLGGNSQAMMIVAIAGSQQFYNDTYNTLNFASKSKKIVNNPMANVVNHTSNVAAAQVKPEQGATLSAWQEAKLKKLAAQSRPQPSASNKRKFAGDHGTARVRGDVLEDRMEQYLNEALERKVEEKVKSELMLREGQLAGQIESKVKDDVMDTLMKTLESQAHARDTPETRRFLASRSLKRARAFATAGDVQLARKEYETAMSFEPTNDELVSEAFSFENQYSMDNTADSHNISVAMTDASTIHPDGHDMSFSSTTAFEKSIEVVVEVGSRSPTPVKRPARTTTMLKPVVVIDDTENDATPARNLPPKRKRRASPEHSDSDKSRSFFADIESSHGEIDAFLSMQEQRVAKTAVLPAQENFELSVPLAVEPSATLLPAKLALRTKKRRCLNVKRQPLAAIDSPLSAVIDDVISASNSSNLHASVDEPPESPSSHLVRAPATVTDVHQLLGLLNSGNIRLIKSLKGIGDKKAKQIVDAVAERPFHRLEDLRRAGFTDRSIERFEADNAAASP
ncbi:hypothetical protein RI367_007774 [Sorochytrium milnesiophthora]